MFQFEGLGAAQIQAWPNIPELFSSFRHFIKLLFVVRERTWHTVTTKNVHGKKFPPKMIKFNGTLTSYGAISTIATLAFPMAVRSGFVCVFIIRVMQDLCKKDLHELRSSLICKGLATALSFPATGLIPSQWSTTKATGTFIAILSCHVQFSSIITMPLAGELCESSLGWPAVFYFQGTFSAIAFTMFFFFYKDDPGMHRSGSEH
ncbi:hypothetical protein DICVIV_06758 [Dictyocaulus viviparus]|uniref:Major facilitator superfamily (MFS) profile domain-containing protein n=1 Tax=Dictyocaulus viviparus TaxID=29172 RepID=A0A0D8XRN8_DICVI|nr:hypothetical protein DICVIV_06758 [Dictyocaulus viviparus]